MQAGEIRYHLLGTSVLSENREQAGSGNPRADWAETHLGQDQRGKGKVGNRKERGGKQTADWEWAENRPSVGEKGVEERREKGGWAAGYRAGPSAVTRRKKGGERDA